MTARYTDEPRICIHMTADMARDCPTCNPPPFTWPEGVGGCAPKEVYDAIQERVLGSSLQKAQRNTRYTDPAALTPEQQQQIRDCAGLIARARAGYVPDAFIRAGLMSIGWPAGAVRGAFKALDGTAQAQPATLAARLPQTAGIALTGQESGQ